MRIRKPIRLGAASTFLAASYLVFASPPQVNDMVHCPGRMTASVTTEACSNNPGPYITIDGQLSLAAIDAVLTFSNNRRGTHTRSDSVQVRVSLSADQVIQFHKQPPLGGVGGNPYIFMELCDEEWNPLSDKVLLGRCVQGLLPVDMNFGVFAEIFAEIAGSCSNNPGPYITLGGDITFGGLNARLTFQNSPRPNAPHQHTEYTELDIQIVEPGGVIRFNKQPPLGGVGGNPHVWVRFECGGEEGPDIYLGRCVQLSNG